MKMIDLHSHLVPGVDDGAVDLEMSLQMLRQARDQGVCACFATPHSSAFFSSSFRTMDAFWELKLEAERQLPELSLYFGCEVNCSPDRMDRTLKALRKGNLPTMNGTHWVLTEFSPWVSPEDALLCVKKLTKAGWRPILAHMERYRLLQGLPEVADQLRDLGCLIQVNAYSLFEESDEQIKAWAQQLLHSRRADFLGTDMHRMDHRPPNAATGLQWLYDHCDRDYADAVAVGNARRLLVQKEG